MLTVRKKEEEVEVGMVILNREGAVPATK